MEGAAHCWPLGMAGRGHSSRHGLGEPPKRTLHAPAGISPSLGSLLCPPLSELISPQLEKENYLKNLSLLS